MSIKVLEVTGLDYAVQEAIALSGVENYVSDSYWTYIENPETLNRAKFEFFLGDKDKDLIMGLPICDRYRVLRCVVVYCEGNRGEVKMTDYSWLVDTFSKSSEELISQLPYKELITGVE